MKKMETLVNVILDQTGSMEIVRDSTISAFNEYIGSLKKDKKSTYRFSLTLFNTVETAARFVNIPVSKVKKLTRETYVPDYMTPLYDAVCQTIKSVKIGLKKNQKSLVVIITDGEENASKEYTEKNFRDLVDELTKTKKWTFVYLGANQESWLNAQKLGFNRGNVMNYEHSAEGIKAMNASLMGSTRAYACSSTNSTERFFKDKKLKK